VWSVKRVRESEAASAYRPLDTAGGLPIELPRKRLSPAIPLYRHGRKEAMEVEVMDASAARENGAVLLSGARSRA